MPKKGFDHAEVQAARGIHARNTSSHLCLLPSPAFFPLRLEPSRNQDARQLLVSSTARSGDLHPLTPQDQLRLRYVAQDSRAPLRAHPFVTARQTLHSRCSDHALPIRPACFISFSLFGRLHGSIARVPDLAVDSCYSSQAAGSSVLTKALTKPFEEKQESTATTRTSVSERRDSPDRSTSTLKD